MSGSIDLGKILSGKSVKKGENYNASSVRVSELGAEVLNSKVAPVAEKALAALKLGKKAFKFTKIQLGSVKPELYNLR